MSVELITILFVALLVILLVSGLPFAWGTGAAAMIISLMLFEPSVIQMTVSRIYDFANSYALVAVPLFVFMAILLEKSGMASQLFDAIYIWCGRLRGGLAVTTIVACTLMAALVGIIGSEIVMFGLIALPAMTAKKYKHSISLGSIAAGGGLATLIPPSLIFILYGLLCNVSIGELYMAGVFPGLLLAALFIAYILIKSYMDPEAAPAASLEEINMPLKAKLALLKNLIAPIILIFLVLGSIYAGIATPTEAAGVGCVGTIIISAMNRTLKLALVKTALYDTVLISSMVGWLLFGSQAIIGVYTLAGGGEFVKNVLNSAPFGKWGVMITIQLIWIFLGTLIDSTGVLMLTMPLFYPVIVGLGFDPVWFGVVFCMNMHIAYISPPFASSAFYLISVTPPDVTLEDIYKATLPYLFITIIALIFILMFPQLSLWLPARMLG